MANYDRYSPNNMDTSLTYGFRPAAAATIGAAPAPQVIEQNWGKSVGEALNPSFKALKKDWKNTKEITEREIDQGYQKKKGLFGFMQRALPGGKTGYIPPGAPSTDFSPEDLQRAQIYKEKGWAPDDTINMELWSNMEDGSIDPYTTQFDATGSVVSEAPQQVAPGEGVLAQNIIQGNNQAFSPLAPGPINRGQGVQVPMSDGSTVTVYPNQNQNPGAIETQGINAQGQQVGFDAAGNEIPLSNEESIGALEQQILNEYVPSFGFGPVAPNNPVNNPTGQGLGVLAQSILGR
tara:strand:- start:152 stop:1027 length:876 start_codon:yes stop_codon:yes gene_type:complete